MIYLLDFINNIIGNRHLGTIFEVGCNDLYALQKLKNKADKLYGIDPIFKNRKIDIKEKNIKVIGDFIENIDLKSLGLKMDVVLSSHTLEHIDNPKVMIKNLIDISSNDTLLFFQFPGLESLVNDAHFDQIFHQHLNYFSLKSVLYMLEDIEAELIDYKVNPYHWGALMIAFRKKASKSNKNAEFLKRSAEY